MIMDDYISLKGDKYWIKTSANWLIYPVLWIEKSFVKD